ncbi:hypothetical protein CR513_57022, partial [Mucuna pruriens]
MRRLLPQYKEALPWNPRKPKTRNIKPFKEPVKRWLEKYKQQHDFKVSKKVLIYDSYFLPVPNELYSKWYGPYIMTKVLPYGAVEVIEGDGITFGVNRHQVRHYEEGPL